MIQSMSVYERLMWKFAWDSGLQLPFPWHNTRYGFTVRPRLVVMDDSTNSDKTLRLRFHGPGSVLSLLTKSDSADLAGWESCHDRNDGWLRRHPRIFRVFKILLKKKKNQRSKIMGHCLPSNSVISGRVFFNRRSIFSGYSTCTIACDLQWLYPNVSLFSYTHLL